jgi:hypothetical protein
MGSVRPGKAASGAGMAAFLEKISIMNALKRALKK